MRLQSLAVAASAFATLLSALRAPPSVAAEPETEKLRSRREFAAAMNKLEEGMLADEVLRLLGPPDDIRTRSDPPGITSNGTREIWRYGTSGHMTTATLGQVYIDEGGQVQYLFGQGEPPPDDFMLEAQLRSLLTALDQVPSYNSGARFNPRLLIRAVNLLQPLGKEQALDVIAEYLRLAPDWSDNGREGVFLVLRALFDVPEPPGYMPRMRVGAPIPREPKDHKLLPRFPLAIEQGVPLLMVGGYFLGGSPERPESHLRIFREGDEFRVRKDLLIPTHQPFEALDDFTRSPRWSFPGDLDSADEDLRMVREQVLRMVDTVYRVEPGHRGTLLPDKATADKTLADARQLKIRWDAAASKYVFLDGTCLPGERPNQSANVWKRVLAGSTFELSIVRLGPRYIYVTLRGKYERGGTTSRGSIRVFEASNKAKSIAEFRAKNDLSGLPAGVDPASSAGRHGEGSTSRTVELHADTEIQAELIVDGKSYLSPVFKP
jgi:hypothetical protein